MSSDVTVRLVRHWRARLMRSTTCKSVQYVALYSLILNQNNTIVHCISISYWDDRCTIHFLEIYMRVNFKKLNNDLWGDPRFINPLIEIALLGKVARIHHSVDTYSYMVNLDLCKMRR